MQSDLQLKPFNDAIANKKLVWWEIHNSKPGHDRDSLYLQFEDGQVVCIQAEQRPIGAALSLSISALPGKPVKNISERVATPTPGEGTK